MQAAEVLWYTIELDRGDMLLMVATSHHHGMLALACGCLGWGARGPFSFVDPRHQGPPPPTQHHPPQSRSHA